MVLAAKIKIVGDSQAWVKKHTMAAVAAVCVIGVTLSFSLVNAFLLEDIQLRWHNDAGGFDYLTLMSSDQKVKICNPGPVPLFINSMTIASFYDKEELGRFVVNGTILPASGEVEMFGTPVIADSSTDIMMMYFDTEFSGNDIARIDGHKVKILTQFDTKILGFIPYSSTEVYSGYYFSEMMNYQIGNFAC